nr:hypothetical protein [Sinobaca sp. H24]
MKRSLEQRLKEGTVIAGEGFCLNWSAEAIYSGLLCTGSGTGKSGALKEHTVIHEGGV